MKIECRCNSMIYYFSKDWKCPEELVRLWATDDYTKDSSSVLSSIVSAGDYPAYRKEHPSIMTEEKYRAALRRALDIFWKEYQDEWRARWTEPEEEILDWDDHNDFSPDQLEEAYRRAAE